MKVVYPIAGRSFLRLSCSKIPHRTRSDADFARVQSLRQDKNRKVRRRATSVYQCRDCGSWHWGHTESSEGIQTPPLASRADAPHI